MNSRQRVLAALNHQEPDRVPIDIAGGAASYISAGAYARMLGAIDAKDKEVRLYDVAMNLAGPSMEFLDRFQADVVPCGLGMTKHWKDYELPGGGPAKIPADFDIRTLPDGSRQGYNALGDRVAYMPATGDFFNQVIHPYADGFPEDFSGFARDSQKIMWNIFSKEPYYMEGEPDFWTQMRRSAEYYSGTLSKAVSVTGGGSFFETGSFFRRMDNLLMDMVLEKQDVFRFFDLLLEGYLKRIDLIIEHLGDAVDIIRFWDDFGTNNGPIFSKELYREMIKPYHKAICAHIKKHSKMKTFLHSCGSVYDFIPDLIDAGIDILNPIQISARDMQPEKLKKEFGKDIVLWGGGCDSVNVLTKKTPAEIREHTLANLEILSRGGGYVFAPTHNILSNVPAQSAIAMYDAAIEFNDRRSQ